MRNLILKQLSILAVAFVGLNGCVSVPELRVANDNYGCQLPHPQTLSSIGIEANISGGILKNLVPNLSIKVDPKVIDMGSKASKDLDMTRYVTCNLINQFNIPRNQTVSLLELFMFNATGPTSEQFIKYVNDRPVLKQIITAVNEDKPLSGLMNGKRLYVDAVRHGSPNSRDGWSKGNKVTLPAGSWEVKAVGGGWSAWSSDNAPPDVKGAWGWFMFVTMDNDTKRFGENSWLYKNKKEANSAAVDVEPLNFSLDKPTDIYFWIWDKNVEDNRGTMIIDIIRTSP